MSQIVEALAKKLPGAVRGRQSIRGQEVLILAPEHLREVCRFLQSQGDIMLTDICGADYPDREKRFEVIYHVYSFDANHRIRLKVQVTEEESIDSLTAIWPAADWDEREIYDMYGVVVDGHPNLTRILNPDCINGFPLRKDYPLEGEEFDIREFVEGKNEEIVGAQD